ncbi:hypothetical protein QBC34DRAFT_378629 [Podospora aff. communis PSN243]|uniref:Uncharacterized protein n=1 Tax=Podospora aff. communis PSN243 TaxID=3040156 RepID=A0AAV9GTH4_9PEZI|nr:hypothetical protein QBC34DRAFT_378629 [Podospora aff. communis PSN243]
MSVKPLYATLVGSSKKRRESDARVVRLRKLETDVYDWAKIIKPPLACLRKDREMLMLLEEEKLYGFSVARVYSNAVNVVIAHGDQARARVFAERWRAVKVEAQGEDGNEGEQAKALAERPSQHMAFERTAKWT